MVRTLDFKLSSENEFYSYSTNLFIKVLVCVGTCFFKHDFTLVCEELHDPPFGKNMEIYQFLGELLSDNALDKPKFPNFL